MMYGQELINIPLIQLSVVSVVLCRQQSIVVHCESTVFVTGIKLLQIPHLDQFQLYTVINRRAVAVATVGLMNSVHLQTHT